jgi:hypothetical protein
MDSAQEWNRPYAEQWLQQQRDQERCKWCGEGDKPLNREQLCAACKRTQRYATKVKKETEGISSTASDHDRWKQTRELRIAEKMEEICKADGELLKTILGDDDLFDVVDLEQAFSAAAFAVCHERGFYHGLANHLALTFTPEQRRILAYLLWKPTLVDRKRRRMMMASHFVHLENMRRAEREAAGSP